MHKDERDLLEVLKSELTFLEKGGYGRSPREPWRPQFIFEDSPTCMNYDSKNHPDPCNTCVLIQLVPLEFRDTKVPCRHIPFSSDGETLDSLYRYADQFEIEQIFGKWLRTTIAKLEKERDVHQSNSAQPTDSSVLTSDRQHGALCACDDLVCSGDRQVRRVTGNTSFRMSAENDQISPKSSPLSIRLTLPGELVSW